MPWPQVILFGLLPPLLFESAFNVDYHVFIKVASMAIVMALPGVILCTVRPPCQRPFSRRSVADGVSRRRC